MFQQIDSCTSISSGDPNIVVDASGGKHFLILFRDHALKFRAIYLCEGDCEEGVITKVTGMGPQNVKLHMIQDLYKLVLKIEIVLKESFLILKLKLGKSSFKL